MTRTTKDNVIVKDLPPYPGKYTALTEGGIYSIRIPTEVKTICGRFELFIRRSMREK